MQRLLFIITLIFLLTSCASFQKSFQKKQTHNKTIKTNPDNWSFIGKFALSDGKENGSGKISYSVQKNMIHAKFKAPLGQGSWEVIERKNNAKLISTRHNPVYGSSAQILISNELGWDFPWNSLIYWLRGYKTHAKIMPHNSSITELHDNGWAITYSKWTATAAGLLPKKIKASKPPYAVKLVIYNWNID